MSGPSANPRKTETVRDLGAVDIGALRANVMAIPEAVWVAENASKPNKFEVLDGTRHIVFRFVDGPLDWRGSHDRPAWAPWRNFLEPVLADAVRDYGYARGVFPRVMLARMAPGGFEVNNLAPHWVRNDGDSDRIHLIFEYYDPDQPEPAWLAPLLQASVAR